MTLKQAYAKAVSAAEDYLAAADAVDASTAEAYSSGEDVEPEVDAFKNAVSAQVAVNAKNVLALLKDPVIAARIAKL